MGAGVPVGWGTNLQIEVQEPKSQRPDYTVAGSTKRPVLPGEDGELPYRTVPLLDETPTHSPVPVVLVLGPDVGTPLQHCVLSGRPNKNPVGGSEEGVWEVEDPVEGDAAKRCWTSSRLVMCEGGCQLGKMQRARCWNRSCGSGKNRGGWRWRSWVPRGIANGFRALFRFGTCALEFVEDTVA